MVNIIIKCLPEENRNFEGKSTNLFCHALHLIILDSSPQLLSVAEDCEPLKSPGNDVDAADEDGDVQQLVWSQHCCYVNDDWDDDDDLDWS